MSAAFVFHPEAEAELREIIRYSRQEWGAAQAREYAAKLRQAVAALAAGQKPYRDMTNTVPACAGRAVATIMFSACSGRMLQHWLPPFCMSVWISLRASNNG